MYYINRLEKEIKYKISLTIIKYINDIRIKNVSISYIKILKDLSLVKIYIFSLEDKLNNNKIFLLNKSSNFIKSKIFKFIKIKNIPKLVFVYDKNIINSLNLIKLINKVNINNKNV